MGEGRVYLASFPPILSRTVSIGQRRPKAVLSYSKVDEAPGVQLRVDNGSFKTDPLPDTATLSVANELGIGGPWGVGGEGG
jgi:hypothetical protein